MTIPSQPKALASRHLREARAEEARVAPHVRPINELIRRIETDQAVVNLPRIDPTFGGIHATVLFMLKAPEGDATPDLTGPRFLSLDNADPTAADLFQLTHSAGLDRRAVTPWNICPFPPRNGGDPTASDVRRADRYHRELFALLPDLRVIVLLGTPARVRWPLVSYRGTAEVLRCDMPSSWIRPGKDGVPRNREKWTHIEDTLRRAAHLAA